METLGYIIDMCTFVYMCACMCFELSDRHVDRLSGPDPTGTLHRVGFTLDGYFEFLSGSCTGGYFDGIHGGLCCFSLVVHQFDRDVDRLTRSCIPRTRHRKLLSLYRNFKGLSGSDSFGDRRGK